MSCQTRKTLQTLPWSCFGIIVRLSRHGEDGPKEGIITGLTLDGRIIPGPGKLPSMSKTKGVGSGLCRPPGRAMLVATLPGEDRRAPEAG